MSADQEPVPEGSPERSEPAPPAPGGPALDGMVRRRIRVALAGASVLVAVNLVVIASNLGRREQASESAVASGSAPTLARSQADGTLLLDAGASGAATEPTADPETPANPADEPPSDDSPHKPEKARKKGDKGRTVDWAAERACSTAPVDGLSRQIIEEARCLDANAFARVPSRKNLTSAGRVFLYLDAPARDHLLRALDAHPDRMMKVNSALRTVAQQYLLSRWGAGKRCGVQLATRPGESNHETGLALDVPAHAAWRSALESEGFRWLGSIDRVHFDYVGAGATHRDGLDVRAFQRLWNRNHRDDAIAESGRYDAATEQRLKRSPAAGFPTGARCGGGHEHRVASDGPARPRER